MFSGIDRIPERDRPTDILRQHSPRYAYASRGKNRSSPYFFVFLMHFGLRRAAAFISYVELM